ncbi:ABC transporter ATP-binding protein [Bacillus shivajii]|uniref:ABC transporter ATP-binding protein n=1 Tax=Bacillus shivajii TaxID=1983719 RepID=UPI001CF963A5|nr:ABC transporter ATP-binding protein [Bacillus shivajii]UCZ51566.1 ABC transporter ATP-binding protein [Bacillus shivajii]
MNAAIELKNLSKVINNKPIIKDVSLSVYPGEVFGFLGPNGAGKTTTIRIITGLMKASKGSVEIGGINLNTHFEKAISQIGAVVETPEMYGYLTGYENLKHYKRMTKAVTDERMNEVIALVGLTSRIHEKVHTYSLGMKQRLGLAQALLHKPKVLILDEPTNGLDPAGIREIRDYLRNLAVKEKIAIIVSSHLLSEMEKMCDRIAVIQQGEIIKVEHVESFVKSTNEQWEVEVAQVEKAIKLIKDHCKYEVKSSGEGFIVEVKKQEIPTLIKRLVEQNISIYEVKKRENQTLEDQFLHLTGGSRDESV